MVTQPVPAGSRISQEFGANATIYNTGAGHSGRDYAVPEGTPVRAIEAGRVLLADWSDNFVPGTSEAAWAARLYFLLGGGGIIVAIDHGAYVSTYSHLSRTDLNPGDLVAEGQIIALSGNTGTMTTGPHLHFEILAKPFNWMNGYYGRVHPGPYLAGTTTVKPQISTGGISVKKEYEHVTKYTTKNQVERSFYGHPAKPTGITLHHWGELGQKFDNVAHFLSTNNVPTSAHTVLEDGRIATLAIPEVATYHAGHTVGNGATIGVECRPEATPGDVDTLVQYVYELEVTYDSMNLYFHRHWTPTACPGRWEGKLPEIINRVNAMHKNGGKDPGLSTKTEIVVETKPVAPKPAPAKEKTVAEENPTGWNVWRYRNPKIEKRDTYQVLRDIDRKQDEILAKLNSKEN